MIRYIIRRLLIGVVILVVVCALTFVFFRVLPTGNPALLRAGRDPQPKLIKEIEGVLGLNKPLPVQFWDYMKEFFLHFNLGYSYYSQESVKSLIAERLPATLSLTVGAAVLWVLGGLSVGIISALRRHSLVDRLSMGRALVLLSVPEFWLGFVFLLLFANDIGKFKILPGAGSYVGLTYDPWKWFTVADHALDRARGRLGRDLRAADAQQPERDDARGLHPHRARQGTARARGGPPGGALGDQPDHHAVRPGSRGAARRRGARRGRVQHPGHRRGELQSDPILGLPRRAGHGAARLDRSSSSRTSSSTSPTRISIRGCAIS